MTDAAPTCQQAVSAADDCCRAEVCDAAATWRHTATGALLCDEHEANAQRWSSGGAWRVGKLAVSYPDGWERIAGEAAPAAGLARVEPGPTLVIERGPFSRA